MLATEQLARMRADVSNYHDSMSLEWAAAVAAHVPVLLAELDRLERAIGAHQKNARYAAALLEGEGYARTAAILRGHPCPCCKEAADG